MRELEAQSKLRQQTFLDGIAAKLGRPRQLERPHQPRRGAPAFWREFQWSPEERAARLREHFEAAGGKLAELPDLEAAGRFIAEQAREMTARRILRQDEAELAQLGLESALRPEGGEVRVWNEDGGGRERWLPEAAEADFGVVLADGAAAYTGTVCVRSAPDKGRSVSLLPTALFVVLPRERLATRLGELLLPLDEAGREAMPAGVHFISGPSRSADIENDLTIGVHGPGIVTILLIG
ncbi:LUD domain-containing protein [Paenibacillus albicereus]|uniref:LUD domain-containing protein n=1 Tax=Paenibacillus albicereus TaxID=2726185 RepID=A0A6H2H3D6_9BACL|nr:LUD domain-containing protein [Paenibacillus albicereus]